MGKHLDEAEKEVDASGYITNQSTKFLPSYVTSSTEIGLTDGKDKNSKNIFLNDIRLATLRMATNILWDSDHIGLVPSSAADV